MKLRGRSQRAKNRIREHGDTMKLIRSGKPECLMGCTGVLVEAPDGWKGWFGIHELESITKEEQED